jgi:hypothetical protein
MKRSPRRIRLHKETLRTIEAPSLRIVAGAAEPRTTDTNACPNDPLTPMCPVNGH